MSSSSATTDQAGQPKPAGSGKRFAAYWIDGFISSVLGIGIGFVLPAIAPIAGALYFLVRDGLDFSFMPFRSVGKKMMGLQVVRLDGQPMNFETSIRRNWVFTVSSAILYFGYTFDYFFIPALTTMYWTAAIGLGILIVEGAMVLQKGRRWGDQWAETVVVEAS